MAIVGTGAVDTEWRFEKCDLPAVPDCRLGQSRAFLRNVRLRGSAAIVHPEAWV